MDEYTLEFDQFSNSSKTTFKANQSEFGTATNITVTPRTRTVSDRKNTRSFSKRIYQAVPYIPYVQKLSALIADVNYAKMSIKQIQDESSQLTDKLKALNKELSKHVDKKQVQIVKHVYSNQLEQQSVMSNASRQSSRSLNPKYFNMDTEIHNTEKIIQKLRAENDKLQKREDLIKEPRYLNDLKNQIQAAQKIIQTFKHNIKKAQQQKKDMENQLQDINKRNGIPAEVKKIHGIKLEINIFETKMVESQNRMEKIQEDMAINSNIIKEKNKIFEELSQKAKALNVPIHQQKQKEMQEQDKRMYLKKLREKLQINEKNIDQMDKQLRNRDDEMRKDLLELKRKLKDADDDIWLKDRDLAQQNKEIIKLMEEAGIEKLQVNNFNTESQSNTSRLNTQDKDYEEDIKTEEQQEEKNPTYTVIRKQSSSQQSKRNSQNSPKNQSRQKQHQDNDTKPKFQHLMEYKRKDSSFLDQNDISANNQSKHQESQENDNDTSILSKPKFIIKKIKKTDEDDPNKENIGYLKLQDSSNKPKTQIENHLKNNQASLGIALKKDGDDNSNLSDSQRDNKINADREERIQNQKDADTNINSKPTFNFRCRSNNQRKSIQEQQKEDGNKDNLFKENTPQKNPPLQHNIQTNLPQQTFLQKQDQGLFPKIEEKSVQNGVACKVEDKNKKQDEDLYSFVPRRVQRNRGGASFTNDSYMPSLLSNDQNKSSNDIHTSNQNTSLPKVNRSNLDNIFEEKQNQDNQQTKNVNQTDNKDQSDILHYKPTGIRVRGGTPYLFNQENNNNSATKPQENNNIYNPSFGNTPNIVSQKENQQNGDHQRVNHHLNNSSQEANQPTKLFNFAARKQQQSIESNHISNKENNTSVQQQPNQQINNNNNKANTQDGPTNENKESKKPVIQEEYSFLGPNDRQRRQPTKVQRENVVQKRNIFEDTNSANNQASFQVKDLTEPSQQPPNQARVNLIHNHQNVNFFDNNKNEGNDSDGLDFLKQDNKPKVNYDDDEDYTFSKNKNDDQKIGGANKKFQIGQKADNKDTKTKELAQKAQNADLFGELDI